MNEGTLGGNRKACQGRVGEKLTMEIADYDLFKGETMLNTWFRGKGKGEEKKRIKSQLYPDRNTVASYQAVHHGS